MSEKKPIPSLPPLRGRTQTTPDDGAVEFARQATVERSTDVTDLTDLADALSEEAGRPTDVKDLTDLAQAKPSERVERFSLGALDLANAIADDDEEISENDHIGRATRPAPPSYESSAHRNVDGTIPLESRLAAPRLPTDAPRFGSTPAAMRGPDSAAKVPSEAVPTVRSEKVPPPSTGHMGRDMGELFALGDYTGALELAEKKLATNPADQEALKLRESCRGVLLQMYSARLGDLERVPIVTVSAEQLRWMSIDPRAGFVLHHIDGVSSLEMVIDVSGMPQLDVMRILADLLQQRVIAFR